MIEGFRVGENEVLLSYLLLVDETIVFRGKSPNQIRWFQGTFGVSCAVSDLSMNLQNSFAFAAWNVEDLGELPISMRCGGRSFFLKVPRCVVRCTLLL